ncbi:aspartate aminotransferase family protein [Rivihabitans pingtungensis]|uniref:aspartate aminotransferase family protein n=1 Tax=Rivihabitans pingtungensis TaxID=1054498 RepID=UPI002356F54A|nr:aspartate aminotransferase family protein [Rivihabitans pingtungensis]MCK6435660.1 aspartate aminotransferase family protein [Rivihabitans pingtungensis]
MNTPRTTQAWQALDAAHHLHPFSDAHSLNQLGSRVVVRGEGVRIWDSEGQCIIDGMAGLWCVNLGYGRKELAEAAYQQMLELPFYNTFFKTTHPPVIELSSLLAELTPPQFNHVFLTNSGSESNDTVIRMARHFWAAQGQPQKKTLISRINAYHGSTIGGASLGGMSYMHAQGDLPIPGIVHIEQPYWYVNGGELSPEEYGLKAARALEAKILELGAENVAAFIGEPIQGAGGVIIPPSTYWPEIQRICREHDILLISDEVICGFGRTGRWFGCEYFGFAPDLMPIAKGLSSGYQPIGGVMVGDRVAQVLMNSGDFNHGMTYSGHPVAAAVAAANLKILRDEGIVDRVRDDTGPYLQKKWQEAFADHPHLDDVRGVGFLAAFTWVKDKSRRELFANPGEVGTICRDIFFKNNLIMRAVGDSMVSAPPLVMTRTEIDEMIALAVRCVDQTTNTLRARGLI